MSTLLDLPSDLLNLIFSYTHVNNLESLKRTNCEFYNLKFKCCDCKSMKLSEFDLKTACQYGYLDIVKRLFVADQMINDICMEIAVENNHINVVTYLHTNGVFINYRAMNWAAKYGYLDVFKCAYNKEKGGISVNSEDLITLGKNGHMHVIEWICENLSPNIYCSISIGAALNGNIDIVKYIVTKYTNSYNIYQCILQCVKGGHNDIIIYLLNLYVYNTNDIDLLAYYLVEYNNIEIIKSFIEKFNDNDFIFSIEDNILLMNNNVLYTWLHEEYHYIFDN